MVAEPFNQRKMITEWLSPLNFAQKQQDVYDSEYANSKNVFLGSKDFRDWQSGKSGILWCQGMRKLLHETAILIAS